MRTHRYSTMVVLLIAFWVNGTLAWGVSKEMVQLQTQVQGLQDQMTQMQTSFNERMGVMQHLMDQNTDSMNKVAASITAVQTSLEKLQTDNGGKVEQLSGQIQALNDSIDELKARLTKVSKQLEDMQAAQQSAAAGQAAQQAQQQALAQAPPPDVLYNNALRDYNAAKNDLAKQEFSDYVKNYGSTDLGSNAQFYLGEISYSQGDYKDAVAQYNTVLNNYPQSYKLAAALLKKGMAESELGMKATGARDLKEVVRRFPGTDESRRASAKLKELGVPATAKSAPR